jgi:hypothetical protein
MGHLTRFLEGSLLELEQITFCFSHVFFLVIANHVGPAQNLSAFDDFVSASFKELQLARWILLNLME